MSGRFFSYFPVQWLGLFFLCLLVRLPWFLSHHFIIDGDEAVIGIMARDLLHGKAFPVYFYGQSYGLSIFEVMVAAVFILAFGSGIWALKLGGIFIFSLGLTFILRTCRHYKLERTVTFFLMVCLAVFPAWILWGSMLRGGYLTAFLCMCILFYLSQVKPVKAGPVVLSALLLGIGFQSHSLVCMAILPFVCSWVLKNKKWTWALVLVPACLFFYFLINTVSAPRAHVWGRPALITNLESIKAGFVFITGNYLEIIAGSYYYELPFRLPVWWKILLIAVHAGIVFLWLKEWKENKYTRLTLTECILMLIFLFTVPVLIQYYSPRYLLGYATCIFFLLAYIIIGGTTTRLKKYIMAGITCCFLAGLIYIPSVPGSWYLVKGNEAGYMKELVQTLQAKKRTYVFCTDPLLQWQLNYLGNDQIFVRSSSYPERTNVYADKVNAAWKNDSTSCVFAGMIGIYYGMDEIPGFVDHVQIINEKYFIIETVTTGYLQKGEYEFPHDNHP